MSYNTRDFFTYLRHGSGVQPYVVPGLKTLTVFCRGDENNLKTLLEPTPFELDGDVFGVQIADFRNADIGAFWDSGVVVPVRYKDLHGVTYLFEWENEAWSIALGRDVWGYPKWYGNVGLEREGNRVAGSVTREGTTVFSISADLSAVADDAAWKSRPLYPHLQVHALPAVESDGFSFFEIVSRDTSADFKLSSREVGQGSVTLGDEIQIGGTKLEVVSTLGAEYTVGDYACTIENGIAKVVERLIP